MVVLPAHLVATPVLERVGGGRPGVVLGAGTTAAWVDLDGFVVAITTREVPLLPNAVALAAGSGVPARAGVGPGAPARLSPGRVDLGPLRITWDPATPPAWDPTVSIPADAGRDSVARRGAALLGALGIGFDPAAPDPVAWSAALVGELARIGLPTAVDPDGAAALRLLFQGIRERDPVPAAAGARELLGRGPGLTPEGDDLLAAVAGTLAVLGPTTGLDGTDLAALLTAVGPAIGVEGSKPAGPLTPATSRTTALSATLLALAAVGRLAEPAGRLLDLGPQGEAAWPAALARLERLGHGSGRAYTAGIAVATSVLATGTSADSGAPVQPGPDGLTVKPADLKGRSGDWTMTEGPGAKDVFGLGERDRQAVLAWVGENLTQVRRSVYEQRLLHWSLGIGLVVGLATCVGGYLLKSSVTTEPLGLVADLFYALGYALWTGVVVVVFVQVFPEVKRRQFKQVLDAYETGLRDQARAGSDQASGDNGAPTAR